MKMHPVLPDPREVAKHYHAQWIARKEFSGKASVKTLDGEELMVPFDQLSEHQQNLDLLLVRMVYSAIHNALDAKHAAEVEPAQEPEKT